MKYLILGLLTSGIVGFIIYFFKPNKFITQFPYINENLLVNSDELACENLVYTAMRADKNFLNEKDGVKGLVQKGTDTLAIKIEGKVMKLLTRASLEVGTMEGRQFSIMQNDKVGLIAIDQSDNAINTFILEKKTGLAIFTKNRLTPFVADHPDSQSMYLICR